MKQGSKSQNSNFYSQNLRCLYPYTQISTFTTLYVCMHGKNVSETKCEYPRHINFS